MRLIWLASLLTMALLGQEEHREGGPGRGPGGLRRPMSALMMALDADRDGQLSAREIQQAPAALRKVDRNGDGKIEGEEMRPQFGGPGPSRREGGPGGGGPNMPNPVDTLMGFDADKDGKLTKAEVPERMQGLFARADANQDGVLTRAELTNASASARGEGGPGGPAGERRPPMMDPIMGALDANHDGVIDAAEMKAAPAALAQLDRNKNGELDATEMRPMMRGRREGAGERRQ